MGVVLRAGIHPLAYEEPPPKYVAEGILKILLDPNIDRTKICCTWPLSGIKSNATFVVDLTKLKHPDDVRKDFFGRWNHSRSHPLPFKACIHENEVEVERCAPGARGEVFYLRRLRTCHPSNTSFR